MNSDIEVDRVKGWGADAADADRPGVPHEKKPAPLAGVHWTKPEQQPLTVEILKHKLRDSYSKSFGTGNPPKGLSGRLRRFAYSIPEHRPEKWMLTLLADRVDVLEHGKLSKAHLLPIAMAGGAIALLTWRSRRSP